MLKESRWEKFGQGGGYYVGHSSNTEQYTYPSIVYDIKCKQQVLPECGHLHRFEQCC